MCISLEDAIWLYRGVPLESPEVDDVKSDGEVHPPRPDRIGERWRQFHVAGDTETGYTSWTTERSIAEEAAGASGEAADLSGRICIFRVRIENLDLDRVLDGRADEYEYLIPGTVENVELSNEAMEEEE